MKKWLRRRIFKRLLKVENLNISKTERKIKRFAYWMTIATLSWVIPFTTDFTEHWVFENPSSVVSESVSPENPADILAVGKDTGDDGVQSGDESDGKVEALIAKAFPEDVSKVMVAIAKAESGLNPKAVSKTDRMSDGRAFSYGLFQINLTVSMVSGVKCNEAFNGFNYGAKVINEELFDRCINLANDVDINIEAAKSKYKGRGNFTAWSSYTSGAYKKFM